MPRAGTRTKEEKDVNDYLIYINGILVSPDLFEARAQTTSSGRFMQLTAETAKIKAEREGHPGGIRSIDVLEVRASNVVRRYRYEHDKENNEGFIKLPANEDTGEKERARFRCAGVTNSF